MGKINNVVCEKIQHQEEAGKSRPDIMFWKNKSRKCIGFILSGVNNGKKGYKLWAICTSEDPGKVEVKIDRDVCGKTYILKLSCYLHFLNYYYLSYLTILSYTI